MQPGLQKLSKLSLEQWLLILFSTLTGITIILQISLGGRTNATSLENALFSVLQFVFSLAFAVLLTRITLRGEFVASQKQFALSAYRRIIEISVANDRLLNRSKAQLRDFELDTYHEMDVVYEISLGIQESIASSIADWADVIGPEIKAVEKIQQYKDTLDRRRDNQNPEETEFDGPPSTYEWPEPADEDIRQLIDSLPESLKQVVNKIRPTYSERLDRARKYLDEQQRDGGMIEIIGFYEGDSGFEKDIYDYGKEEVFYARTGDVGNRVGVLVIYDKDHKSVAMIMNHLPMSESYKDFCNLLFDYLKRSHFDIRITTSMQVDDSSRNWFRAEILTGSNDGKREKA